MAAGEVEAFKHGKAFPRHNHRGFLGVLDEGARFRHKVIDGACLVRIGFTCAHLAEHIHDGVHVARFRILRKIRVGKQAGQQAFGRFIPEVAMVLVFAPVLVMMLSASLMEASFRIIGIHIVQRVEGGLRWPCR